MLLSLQVLLHIVDQMMANFGGGENEVIGMDPTGFLMDNPLMVMLQFIGDAMPASPEEVVDDLLGKLYVTS